MAPSANLAARCLLIACVVLAVAAQRPSEAAPQRRATAGKKKEKDNTEELLRFGAETTVEYRAGIEVEATSGAVVGLIGLAPVPFDWPEQTVRISEEDVSPSVRDVEFRMIGKTVQQMVVSIPRLDPGEKARAVITFEVTRREQLPPEDPSVFVIPRRPTRDVRIYLGSSPGIETRSPRIRKLAREVIAEHETAWSKVEALYDWVREHVKYTNGPFKGALAALKDGTGDCEEMTSLFIAMCRAIGVPARTVWIPGHCYPEFYLEDEQGRGVWFPCQAAGDRAFGRMKETRPIMQKGDSFPHPETPRRKQRYAAEFVRADGKSKPKVRFIRELLGTIDSP